MRTFTNGDRDIVRFVNEFKLVTVDHLERLTGRKTVWRRLPVLLEHKQIFKKERGINEKFIYSSSPIKQRSPFTLEHDLLITDIHVALHTTGKLIYWEQGKETWKTNVHQDAFCTLEHPLQPDLTIDCFIEADTGTQNHRTIALKLQGYLDYFQRNPSPFRVVFATNSEARAKNLARVAETCIDPKRKKLYWFTPVQALRQNCFGPIGYMPYEQILTSIFPGLA
jgi:protein involved in plasmid replication-relaxation